MLQRNQLLIVGPVELLVVLKSLLDFGDFALQLKLEFCLLLLRRVEVVKQLDLNLLEVINLLVGGLLLHFVFLVRLNQDLDLLQVLLHGSLQVLVRELETLITLPLDFQLVCGAFNLVLQVLEFSSDVVELARVLFEFGLLGGGSLFALPNPAL